MKYRTRIGLAVSVSLLFHTAYVVYRAMNYEPAALGVVAEPANPIVVTLNPPEAPPLLRLIEGGAPAEAPPKPTDLVSNRDLQAQDQSTKSDGIQPDVESPAEFDELAAPELIPAAPQPPATEPAPPAEPAPDTPKPPKALEELPEEPLTEPPAPLMPESEVIEPQVPEPTDSPPPDSKPPEPIGSESFANKTAESATPKPIEQDQAEAPPAEPLPERFEVAKADQFVPPQINDIGTVRGREGEGAQKKGELSFEASKHALGDYMLDVRRKVERSWRSSLQFQFSGTSKVAAVLECTIGPDGTLVEVAIIDRGESFVYAALCKQAIEKAAPFGPFPFNIPAAHREENLVIRWKFTYM